MIWEPFVVVKRDQTSQLDIPTLIFGIIKSVLKMILKNMIILWILFELLL